MKTMYFIYDTVSRVLGHDLSLGTFTSGLGEGYLSLITIFSFAAVIIAGIVVLTINEPSDSLN